MRGLAVLGCIFFASGGAINAHEEIPAQFYCEAEERFLSDEDFIRLALGYESTKKASYEFAHHYDVPEGYVIGDVDEFLNNNPECCSVVREAEGDTNSNRGFFPGWINGCGEKRPHLPINPIGNKW